MAAKTVDWIVFATNDNAAREGGVVV